jgi:hypothetical protein
MQNVLVIDNHSVRTDLLVKGPVLDAGSRGLAFSRWFAARGHKVVALDAGEDEKADGVSTHKMALVHSKWAGGNVALAQTSDLNARYIEGQSSEGVYGISIPVLMHDYGIVKWDVIKLNIEGSEYDILDEIDGPISRQIVFGMHEHTQAARGRAECDRIIDKLRQWYTIHNQVWERRYGCIESYWDVLCIEKGIQ